MDDAQAWYAVRTVVRIDSLDTYEERITLWRASSFEDAMEKAEREREDYCETLDGVACDLVQAFELDTDELGEGVEVFSLMRDSELAPDAYVDAFFDSGGEHQRTVTP